MTHDDQSHPFDTQGTTGKTGTPGAGTSHEEMADLQAKVTKAAETAIDAAFKAAAKAMEMAGGMAHDKRSELHGFVDKAADKVNERTEGKYADRVEKAKASAKSGLDKLAEKSPDEGTDGTRTAVPGASHSTGGTTSTGTTGGTGTSRGTGDGSPIHDSLHGDAHSGPQDAKDY